MGVALLLARLVLAAIFGVAGVAKLSDLGGSMEAVAGFGVPRRFSRAAGIALPLAELLSAALLLPAATASFGLTIAVALLLAFTIAIGTSMARGQAPDCHCFGQLHSEPAGPRTLARNVTLLAAATAALAVSLSHQGPSALAWVGRLAPLAASAVVVVALAAAAGAVWYVVRATRATATRAQGLSEGTPAPPFALATVDGPEVSLDELLRRGPPVVLVFTDSHCTDCKVLLPELGPVQRDFDHAVTVAVVNAGDPHAVRGLAVQHGLQDVLFDETREVQKAYAVHGAPAAVRVEAPGTTTTLVVGGVDLVRAMVETTATGQQELRGLPPGQPLPADVVVTDLDGTETRLLDLADRETLFLFWDPDCGSCREIREELLSREAEAASGAAQLVIITSEDARAVRREGFRSPVVVDPDRKAAEALGAIGTPMAMLVDAQGRIGWPLAVGRSHILRLIRSRPRVAALTTP